MNRIFPVIFLMTLLACNNDSNKPMPEKDAPGKQEYTKGEFGYDLNKLKQYHPDLVVLGDDSSGAQVIVLPAYQGRVMTSTAAGNSGASFGWINHDLIASGKPVEHMNAFGGEDRFWLGPEGGQFSIFFKKGTAFTYDNWFVPREFDTEPFTVVAVEKNEARFKKEMHFENYSGYPFDLEVNRTVRLLDKAATDSALGIVIPDAVQFVAFESDNSTTNKGATAWTKKTGMLSIWILGMLNASGKTTVAVPYNQHPATGTDKIVTDDYFGKVPADRLKVKDGLILFKADGNHRSKIGLSPARALPLMASYDAVNSVLTIAQFTLPSGATDYVNSLWKLQDDPFSGDAVNSYNDGPINGKQMGNFYEMESSSPAAALKPGETIRHLHRTIHLKGDKKELDQIALRLLGVGVDAITL